MPFLRNAMTVAFAVASMSSAIAQDKPSLKIELNNLDDVSAGCRFTFVTANTTGSDLSKTAFEIAFFNADGLVERLTTLNFGKLADGRTTVRQFEIPGGKCESYSRLLVNAVKSCEGAAGGTEICEDALSTSNKSKIEFGA